MIQQSDSHDFMYTAAFKNVDPTRTHLNIEYCYTPIKESYHQLFDAAQAECNAKQGRKDRRIEKYYSVLRIQYGYHLC